MLLVAAVAWAEPMTDEQGAQVLATLSGSWPAHMMGQTFTVRIEGQDRWVAWPGQRETHDTIRVISPCTLLATPDEGLGGSIVPFAVHQGRVYTYNGFAVRQGDAIWMCYASYVAQLAADGTCTNWGWWIEEDTLKWKPEPGSCRQDGASVVLSTPPTTDLLTGKVTSEVRFEERGEGLWSTGPLEGEPLPGKTKKKAR